MRFIASICILFSLVFLVSCKKTTERFCWQIINHYGHKVDIICDKTEQELFTCINNQECVPNMGVDALRPCSYFKIEGEKKCWMYGTNYIHDVIKNEAWAYSKCFGGNVEPIETDCRNCKNWYHRKKMTFKPTNTFTYSSTRVETFCGDTARTLFQGRQIIIKDDADSLIVIQFSSNGTNW